MHSTTRLAALITAITVFALSPLSAQDGGGASSPRSGVTFWTENDYLVPICWDGPGLDEQKQLIEAALRETWEANSGLRFTFTEGCPDAGTERFLKVDIQAGNGGTSGVGMSETFRSPEQGPATHVWVGPSVNPTRVRHIGVHEIGHALGFRHEQGRAENLDNVLCDRELGARIGSVWLTPFDASSVMNYCGPEIGELSEFDVDGVRALYGWPGRAIDIGLGFDQCRPWVIGVSGRVFRWDYGDWVVMRDGSHLAIDVGPDGDAWVIDDANRIWRFHGDSWNPLPGRARDVGVGADGTPWIISTSGQVLRWNVVDWGLVRDGEHVAIDVGPDGAPWVIDSDLRIWHLDGTEWSTAPGVAIDVGIGSNGTVWVVGATSRNVFHWDNGRWITWPGSRGNATRVSIGPNGQVGVVDDDSRIFIRRSYGWPGGEWQTLPGSAIDGGIGLDGSIWIIGTSGRVFRWETNEWVVMRNGVHVAIDVGPDGNAWVIDDQSRIWRSSGASWTQIAGNGKDVGIGHDGTVWVVAADRGVYRWNGSAWDFMRDGVHSAIDVDIDGHAWLLDSQDRVWEWTGRSWDERPGLAVDIGLDSSGYAWASDPAGELLRWDGHALENKRQARHVALSVGPRDEAWAIAEDNGIWRLSGDQWEQMPGNGLDVGVNGRGGSVWLIGTSGRVFFWNGSSWDLVRDGRHLRIDVDHAGLPYVVDENGRLWVGTVAGWVELPGRALDVGVGAGTGELWSIDIEGKVVRWMNGGWELMRGGSHQAIDVDADGRAIVAQTNGEIWRFTGSRWVRLGGGASEVSMSADGRPWVLGSSSGNVFRWVGDRWHEWQTAPSGAQRVAAGEPGQVLVIDANHEIHLRQIFGVQRALDVGLGDNVDHPWIIDRRSREVLRWEGASWQSYRPGRHIAIDVGSDDNVWVVDESSRIFARKDGVWSAMPGAGRDIGVGSGNTPWIVDVAGNVARWNGSAWETMLEGDHIAVDVGPDGTPWAVRDTGGTRALWTRDGAAWVSVASPLYTNGPKDVGVGSDGTVWVVGELGDSLFRRSGDEWVRVSSPPTLERVSGGPGGRVAAISETLELMLLGACVRPPPAIGSALLGRGDCNDDGTVDISDAAATLRTLFLGEGDFGCRDACDSNDDGTIDISDPSTTLGVLFLGRGDLPLPHVGACGVDPSDDALGCERPPESCAR